MEQKKKSEVNYEEIYNSRLTLLIESFGQSFKDNLPSDFFDNSVDWKLVYIFKNTEKRNQALEFIQEKYDHLKQKYENKFMGMVTQGVYKDLSTDFASEWLFIIYDKLEKIDLAQEKDPRNFMLLYPLTNACKYFLKKNSRSKENNKKTLSDKVIENYQSPQGQNEIDDFIDRESVKKILKDENPLMFRIYEILQSNPKIQTRRMAALLGMADNEPEVSRKKTELLEILQREGYINRDYVKTLTPRQTAILDLYNKNPKMKQREMMMIVGCDEFALSREMKHLRNLGFIPKKQKKS